MNGQLPWDLSQAIGIAVQETQEAQNRKKKLEEGSFEHKLIYPSDGKLKVRILYNPKSRITQRKIIRHKIGDVRLPCAELYGQECLIDKTFDEIYKVKGVDLWAEHAAKTYGICYAQFVAAEGINGSDYFKGWNQDDTPKSGEIIFLMYPPSVYKEINRVITEAGQNAYLLIASNIGKPVIINKYYEGNKNSPTYKVEVDAWGDYRSFETDQQYVEALENLPDLNDKMVPKEMTNEVIQSIREVCDQFKEKYLKNNVLNPGQDPNQMPSNTGTVANVANQQQQSTGYVIPANAGTPTQAPPAQSFTPGYVNTQQSVTTQAPVQQPVQTQTPTQPANTAAPAPTQPPVQPPTTPTQNNQTINKPAGAPECYGTYKTVSVENPNKCLACPHELQCDEASQ